MGDFPSRPSVSACCPEEKLLDPFPWRLFVDQPLRIKRIPGKIAESRMFSAIADSGHPLGRRLVSVYIPQRMKGQILGRKRALGMNGRGRVEAVAEVPGGQNRPQSMLGGNAVLAPQVFFHHSPGFGVLKVPEGRGGDR